MNLPNAAVTRVFRGVIFGMCLVALCGCSSLGRSPSSSFYVLVSSVETPQQAVEQTQLAGPRVTIGPVILPGYLDRNQLFLRPGNTVGVQIAEFHLWGEPLNEGIVRVLCETVSNGLATIHGMAVPWRASVPSDWQLRIDINRFDGAPGHAVIIDAGWILYNKNGEIIRQGYLKDTLPAGETLDDMVRAQSHLMSHFGELLAQMIKTL